VSLYKSKFEPKSSPLFKSNNLPSPKIMMHIDGDILGRCIREAPDLLYSVIIGRDISGMNPHEALRCSQRFCELVQSCLDANTAVPHVGDGHEPEKQTYYHVWACYEIMLALLKPAL
jgi:hypothetical protein